MRLLISLFVFILGTSVFAEPTKSFSDIVDSMQRIVISPVQHQGQGIYFSADAAAAVCQLAGADFVIDYEGETGDYSVSLRTTPKAVGHAKGIGRATILKKVICGRLWRFDNQEVRND